MTHFLPSLRMCIHQLLHIADYVECWGSLIPLSQFCCERQIGSSKREVRSDKEPFTNCVKRVILREQFNCLDRVLPTMPYEKVRQDYNAERRLDALQMSLTPNHVPSAGPRTQNEPILEVDLRRHKRLGQVGEFLPAIEVRCFSEWFKRQPYVFDFDLDDLTLVSKSWTRYGKVRVNDSLLLRSRRLETAGSRQARRFVVCQFSLWISYCSQFIAGYQRGAARDFRRGNRVYRSAWQRRPAWTSRDTLFRTTV